MIRLRGTPISDTDAGELARWLRDIDPDTARRLDSAADRGSGLLAISRPEARAILNAISQMAAEDNGVTDRLDELIDAFHDYVTE